MCSIRPAALVKALGKIIDTTIAALVILTAALLFDSPALATQVSLPTQLPAIAGDFHETIVELAVHLADEPALANSVAVALLQGADKAARERLAARKDNRSTRFDATDLAMELWVDAREQGPTTAAQTFKDSLDQRLRDADPELAHKIGNLDTYDLDRDRSFLGFLLSRLPEAGVVDVTDTEADYRWALVRLVETYARYQAMTAILPPARAAITDDRNRRYLIETDVLIRTPHGISLSAMVVRPRALTDKSPAILNATIYSDPEDNLHMAIQAAAHGYVGVVSDSRGKRMGSGEITPYENESKDVHAVIDWISRQDWNDGQVAMHGGSYLGYTQWAATRGKHPALKTIVPSVAAMPGQGLPMENNVFLNANYPWSAFVTNDKLNDGKAYDLDWRAAAQRWYEAGRPYREFDQIAGTPNPWLQKWLEHPAFDGYWQSMIPSAADYASLDIPVLSITGYYDDGQISALKYVRDHYRHNAEAQHYVVIGPYDHFSAQISAEPTLRGYRLDDVAHIDIPKLTFEWFDHVLKNAPRPALIKDRINYQLMGANSWRHAPSLAALQSESMPFFLDTTAKKDLRSLTTRKPGAIAASRQTVDLADRSQTHNNHNYPYPIIQERFEIDSGFAFVSEPFQNDMELSGVIEGQLQVRINKRDFDIGLVLYEITESGELFHLNFVLGRASFAKDPTRRQLLEPGQVETIPVPRSRMVAKKISAGSRLLLLADVNMNTFAQINYGTGKDVSDESIEDAGEPLQVEWMNSSFISLPLRAME